MDRKVVEEMQYEARGFHFALGEIHLYTDRANFEI